MASIQKRGKKYAVVYNYTDSAISKGKSGKPMQRRRRPQSEKHRLRMK